MREYSRRQLYQAGEALGESCTRMEGGRRIYGGGSSKSKSSSSTTTNTRNEDKRIAIESGVGVNAEGSNITVEALDAGIVAQALDTVKAADATSGEGFQSLLSLADKLFTGAGSAINAQQETTLETLKTINTAANDQKGSIDQKTLIVLGVAAAGAAVMMKRRK